MKLSNSDWEKFATVAFRHLVGPVTSEMIFELQSEGNDALEIVWRERAYKAEVANRFPEGNDP